MLGAGVLVPAIICVYLYLQAGHILYYKYGRAYWQQQHPAHCNAYRQRYFEKLQPAAPPLDYSCKEALKLPAESAFAQSADGLKIHYRLFQSPLQQAPLLVHISGITSDWLNAARYVKAAERMGFQLVALEMRGHGSSETTGEGVRYGCQESADLIAVVQALTQRFPKRKLYLWGSSGGTMAIVNAGTELSRIPQLKAVVLENPISSLRDVASAKSPGYPGFVYNWAVDMASWRGGVDFQRCAPVAQAHSFRLPALVTVSEQDTLTPVWMAKKLFEALPEPKALKRYPLGQHERIWNAQPRSYEQDILQFWQRAARP